MQTTMQRGHGATQLRHGITLANRTFGALRLSMILTCGAERFSPSSSSAFSLSCYSLLLQFYQECKTMNRTAVVAILALSCLPALAAWSQYPSARAVNPVAPVVRSGIVAPSAVQAIEVRPVVILAHKPARKAVKATAYTYYPRRAWHDMLQGPVTRMVRDL
jgi:hypothetical protein